MFTDFIDRVMKRPATYLASDAAIHRHGINRLMKWARVYNSLRYRRRKKSHLRAFKTESALLLAENAGGHFTPPPIRMVDGWALDTSGTLPHLEALLAQTAEVIGERAGRLHSFIQRPFLRAMQFPSDHEKYPAFLDFVCSSAVLSVAMAHLQTIPVISKTTPQGYRLMESHSALDPEATSPPRDSQLYHIDLHDSPLMYVLVLLEDVTSECGPWTFLPAAASQRISKQLGYREKGRGHRLEDQDIRPLIKADEEIVFALPKGSVLFIDSSQCLHFGSRDAILPRYMMMYALTSPCRQDFVMAYKTPITYPVHPSDSRLRRMVLS